MLHFQNGGVKAMCDDSAQPFGVKRDPVFAFCTAETIDGSGSLTEN